MQPHDNFCTAACNAVAGARVRASHASMQENARSQTRAHARTERIACANNFPQQLARGEGERVAADRSSGPHSSNHCLLPFLMTPWLCFTSQPCIAAQRRCAGEQGIVIDLHRLSVRSLNGIPRLSCVSILRLGYVRFQFVCDRSSAVYNFPMLSCENLTVINVVAMKRSRFQHH